MSESFVEVNRKVSRVVRESSIYNFLEFNKKHECIAGYELQHITRSKNDNPAYLIKLPILVENKSSSGHIKLLQHHLTVDKFYSREESSNSLGFSFAHYSAYFSDEATGAKIEERVYFNREGNEIQRTNNILHAKEEDIFQARIVLINIIGAKNEAYLTIYKNQTLLMVC